MGKNRSFFAGVGAFGVALLLAAAPSLAKVEYHLNKVENPSADELDAYEQITAAMDSAVFLYNKYTHLSKHIEVYYNTGVQTADASYNGTMRFGSNRSYMRVRTAIHEMGHIMGMGTTSEYTAMLKDGVFQGETAQAKLKELTGDPTAVLKGDSQHFWPYGLNYDSELHSEEDLIIHCQIVEAMYQDIFKESFYMTARVRSEGSRTCMGINSSNGLEMMDCSKDETLVKIWAVGENPVAYRFEFGDRVLDVPNESTQSGAVLGTYYWNAGAHQKILLEPYEDKFYYLKNVKSALYLTATVDNSVKQLPMSSTEYCLWSLVKVETVDPVDSDKDSSTVKPVDSSQVVPVEPPADTSVAQPPKDSTSLSITRRMDAYGHIDAVLKNRKFDAKGRSVKYGRRQSKYMKLF